MHIFTSHLVSAAILATAAPIIFSNVLQILDVLDYSRRTDLKSELCRCGPEGPKEVLKKSSV